MRKNLLCVVMVLLLSVVGVTLGCEPSAIRHNNNGIKLANEGKYDEAIVEYDKAIALDRNYSLAYNNRGAAFQNKGLYDLAIANYTKAIELDPNDVTAKNNKDQLEAYVGGGGGQKGTTGRVAIFPSETYIELEGIPHYLSLRAVINGISIGVNDLSNMTNRKYKVEWFLGDGAVPISTEVFLNEGPFIKAIGNKPGTYIIKLRVTDKATGTPVGDMAQAKVTAKGKETIAGGGHWVSAVPGKGLIIQIQPNPGYKGDGPPVPTLRDEFDVDLRVTGSTGSMTLTGRDYRGSATTRVTTIKDWKDNGTTVSFTAVDDGGNTGSLQLTRTPNGHLTRTVIYNDENSSHESVSTWDLVPAP